MYVQRQFGVGGKKPMHRYRLRHHVDNVCWHESAMHGRSTYNKCSWVVTGPAPCLPASIHASLSPCFHPCLKASLNPYLRASLAASQPHCFLLASGPSCVPLWVPSSLPASLLAASPTLSSLHPSSLSPPSSTPSLPHSNHPSLPFTYSLPPIWCSRVKKTLMKRLTSTCQTSPLRSL